MREGRGRKGNGKEMEREGKGKGGSLAPNLQKLARPLINNRPYNTKILMDRIPWWRNFNRVAMNCIVFFTLQHFVKRTIPV